MRKRSYRSIALAGAVAIWYCAAALTQTTGGAQDTQRAQANPNPTRCAGLTGVQRAECERRDSTEELPAGVTQGQAERKALRVAEATRDTQTRPIPPETRRTPPTNTPSNSADTMRAPPTSAPTTSTTTPAATAPPPASTPRDNVDTLNRPRE